MGKFSGVVAVYHKFSVRLKLQCRGNPIVRQKGGEAQIGLSRKRLALECHPTVHQTLGAAPREGMDGISPFGPSRCLPYRISRETGSDVRGVPVGVGAGQARA